MSLQTVTSERLGCGQQLGIPFWHSKMDRHAQAAKSLHLHVGLENNNFFDFKK
jgi:hypothetical protein